MPALEPRPSVKVRLDPATFNVLSEFCRLTGEPRSRVVEQLVEEFVPVMNELMGLAERFRSLDEAGRRYAISEWSHQQALRLQNLQTKLHVDLEAAKPA